MAKLLTADKKNQLNLKTEKNLMNLTVKQNLRNEVKGIWNICICYWTFYTTVAIWDIIYCVKQVRSNNLYHFIFDNSITKGINLSVKCYNLFLVSTNDKNDKQKVIFWADLKYFAILKNFATLFLVHTFQQQLSSTF